MAPGTKNIEKLKICNIEKLKIHDTYGCNYNGINYSGNFWWANVKHIRQLPNFINSGYQDPEDWVCSLKKNYYSAFNSGFERNGHYFNKFPEKYYK